ncbi:MAG: glutaredoxin family protein, partial [Anaerolineales bacterium]|nr:glutaredoxin family protein [Anaerolineales bacterium]
MTPTWTEWDWDDMRVTLYGRPGCVLCDEVREALRALQADLPHDLVEVNIESDATLLARYVEQIPVVSVGPYTLRAPIASSDLRVALQAAASAPAAANAVTPRASAVRVNRSLLFISRHWLAMFNLLILLYVGLPFLAPVLMRAGAERQARWIYMAYSPLCHQWAFRSWFLFGPQAAYPRALAGTSLTPYGVATGLDENDLIGARTFVGNPQVGYKVALCERDI